MKKLFSVLLVLFLVVGLVSPVLAGRYDREDANNVGYVEASGVGEDTAVVTGPCYVYALTTYAAAANSYTNLYDASTTPVPPNKPKAEVGAATQYSTVREVYDPPLKLDTGLYLDVTNGSAVVEYRR